MGRDYVDGFGDDGYVRVIRIDVCLAGEMPLQAKSILTWRKCIMNVSIVNSIGGFLSLSWLTGPIFDKELRVSSRRRRNYILRSAYLFLLTFFVGYIWLVTVRLGGSPSATFRVSRMAIAGTAMVTTIAWFQFISLQLIAMVMLSNAINLEVHKKTLDALVSTPITSP